MGDKANQLFQSPVPVPCSYRLLASLWVRLCNRENESSERKRYKKAIIAPRGFIIYRSTNPFPPYVYTYVYVCRKYIYLSNVFVLPSKLLPGSFGFIFQYKNYKSMCRLCSVNETFSSNRLNLEHLVTSCRMFFIFFFREIFSFFMVKTGILFRVICTSLVGCDK